MSDEDKEWEIGEDGQTRKKEQSGRKLKIEISRDQEIDSLHEELARTKELVDEGDRERIEAEKSIMALELFDITKNYEAQPRPKMKEQIFSCKTPQELTQLIQNIHPSGKAQLERLQSSDGQTIDELYTILKFPQNYDKEIVKDAKQKRATLIQNLLSSPSLETMRREGKTVYANNAFMFCPKCERNAILSTIDIKKDESCSKCGYRLTEDERRR